MTLIERLREMADEAVIEFQISNDYLAGRKDALREALEIAEEEEGE
jgi:hypothetical protein